MKNIKKGLFSVLMLLSISSVLADTTGNSFFLSNAGNVSRLPQMGAHKDSDKMYGHAGVQFEYMGSTKASDLGKFFFFGGDNDMIVGARKDGTTTASTTEFYNVNLLLPIDYNATVTIKPVVNTFTTNLSAFIGLDEFCEGLHLTVDAPIVYTKSNMKLSQGTATGIGTTYIQGLVDRAAATTPTVPNTIAEGFVEAIKGQALVNDVTSVMSYGKINGSQSQSGLGNTTVALGYDFMNKENCHLGLAVVGMFNGSKNSDDQAKFWGETGIGTYGRHGAGGRLNGRIRAYESDNAELNLHLNAEVLAGFKGTQRRTYDWDGHGVGSRYILMKEMTTAFAYNEILHYGTNISTVQAKISIPVMYDVSLVGRYTNGNYCVDLGYQLNGHSKEKHHSWVDTITGSKYGHFATDILGGIDNTTLAATASFTGTNSNDDTSSTVQVSGDTSSGAVSAAFTAARSLTEANLTKNSALAPSAASHRIHGAVHYNWDDSDWQPALGVNAGYQIGGSNEALSGWVVGLNGSVCF